MRRRNLGGADGAMLHHVAVSVRGPREEHGAKAVEWLLARRADIELQDGLDRTALAVAIERGNSRVAKALVEARAAISAEDRFKQLPLHLAAERGHVELVLEARAAVGAQDHRGTTPRSLALRNNNNKV